MVELTRRTPTTLRDQVDGFINTKDTIWALTEPKKIELEQAGRKAKASIKAKAHEKTRKGQQDRRRDEVPTSRGMGPRYDRFTLSV